ncbi:Uma2 family endonuclease [Gemmata sp.]|uniref:Uma2 family endonuclease n=1 Tax=Gemmata sp. TaxID=1914242 RepID=UPI003F71BBAB
MTTATVTPPPAAATPAPTQKKVWTEADLLAMPDDGVRRWIIKGQLREEPSEYPGVTMTVRNRHHSEIMSWVATTVGNWLRTQPKPRGKVYTGEIGVRLPGSSTAVGADVAYAPPGVVATQDDDKTTMLDGRPALVVEILSPTTTQEQLDEKIDTYLEASVPAVWVVHPTRRTVTVHCPGHEPELFNVTHRLPANPEMPGFAPAVLELFE